MSAAEWRRAMNTGASRHAWSRATTVRATATIAPCPGAERRSANCRAHRSHPASPHSRAGDRARLSLGGEFVFHFPDRRTGAGFGSDRALAHFSRRLWRHGLVGADERRWRGWLHGGDFWRRRSRPGRRQQPGLAVVARRHHRRGDRDGLRHLGRLALGADRRHLHDHDHARHRRVVLLPGAAELLRIRRSRGLQPGLRADGARHRFSPAHSLLLPGALLGACRLLLHQVPAARAVRRGAPRGARQSAPHECARLQCHRASGGRLCGRRRARRDWRRADGLVQQPCVAGIGEHGNDAEHPHHRRDGRA